MKRPIFIVTPYGDIVDIEKPCIITLNDVAKGLSQVSRFKGDTIRPYSVARHSFVVSYLVPAPYALEALLHDAPEAYLGDLISPVKALCPDYQRLEQIWWEAVAFNYQLPKQISKEVHAADRMAFLSEAVSLLREDNRAEYLKVLGIDPTKTLTLEELEVKFAVPKEDCIQFQFVNRALQLLTLKQNNLN